MTASLSAAGISSSATILQMAADIVAMSGRQAVALNAIAHCDDLVIRGEDDGPELARRLRFAVNTAEAALSGQNADVDLPDTAAQESALKPNSPAVSG
jgi:phage tail tape-measure protein